MPRIFSIFDKIETEAGLITPMRDRPSPENLSAVPQGDYIYVSWDPFLGAISYLVYRSVSPDWMSATLIAEPTQTSYTDMTLIAGQTYYYWVQATLGPGSTSGVTGPVAATAPIPIAPPEEVPAEPIPPPEPTPEPTPTPEPEPGFVPGQNIKRISDVIRKRLEEIQKEKAAGRWPPWGYR